MRILVVLPLLAVATLTFARPQNIAGKTNKPITEEISKLLGFRTDTPERTNKAANPAIRDSMKIVANQLIDMNTTADFTMDTRTPPKIRMQQKNQEKKKQETHETSHPGVAIPVELETLIQETTTQKRVVIHKTENKKPTTDSGISTWILLSEPTTTMKPVRMGTTQRSTVRVKTTVTTQKPTTPVDKVKATTTTKKPTTSSVIESTKLMTKIKASVLNNAVNNKNKTASTTDKPAPISKQPTTTKPQTSSRIPTTTKQPPSSRLPTTAKLPNSKPTTTAKPTTKLVKIAVTTPTTKTSVTPSPSKPSTEIDSSLLPPEAKDGSVDLYDGPTTKRPVRPTIKKKKNKNRRRKPVSSNSTKIAHKDKPIGTQIYNYLSREVMPTVGVGLVGLMVTAGLASYFFNPFGGLRRTFEEATDRKDQYFYDEYGPGGVAEEEMIGKVIAGMPSNSDYSVSYRSPVRSDYYRNEVGYKYRNSDYTPYQNNYQTANVGSRIDYGSDIIEKETGYTVDDNEYSQNQNQNQFVVGNYPKEYTQAITPAAVPEHGPRSLRIRRSVRKLPTDDKENEIDNEIHPVYPMHNPTTSEIPEPTVEPTTERTDPTITTEHAPKSPNFLQFMKNIFEMKVRIGLDLLQKTTQSFSRYLQGVQQRVEHVFASKNNTETL